MVRPEIAGDIPADRFGSAAAIWDDKLWIVGGGVGNDCLRSGHDLFDVHTLDLDTLVWSRCEPASRPAGWCVADPALLVFSLESSDKAQRNEGLFVL
jgi:hypothetical protein